MLWDIHNVRTDFFMLSRCNTRLYYDVGTTQAQTRSKTCILDVLASAVHLLLEIELYNRLSGFSEFIATINNTRFSLLLPVYGNVY